MTTIDLRSVMGKRSVGLAALVLWAWSAGAQTTPSAQFQYATLTGNNNTITATSIPVTISPGVTVYVNLTLQFNVDSNGNLTVATGSPTQTVAPAALTSAFQAGSYVGPSTINSGNSLINVAGPGITSGGATEWSLSTATGANGCTYPNSATWYVVPSPSASPLASRLQSAGITSTAWYYGTGGSSCGNAFWINNSLLGFSQVGNTITIASFTHSGSDFSVPVDQITYTLKQ